MNVSEGDVLRLDFKRITPGRMQDYIQLERDYLRLREAQVKAGAMKGWGMSTLVLPSGSEHDFDAYTVHTGKDLEQVMTWGRGTAEIAAKLDPPFNSTGLAMRGNEVQKIIRGETRLAGHVGAPAVGRGRAGAAPLRWVSNRSRLQRGEPRLLGGESMKIGRAIAAGIAGAVVMSVLMAVARRLGFDVNLEALLGSAFGVAEPYKWLGGFAIHLSIGGIVALLYATAFEYAIQRSGWWVGAIFGLAHGMMAGLFMTAIPAMDPAIPGTMSAPGPFLSYVRFGPEMFLGLHVLYGAVVGLVYRPVNRAHEVRAQGTRSLTHAK